MGRPDFDDPDLPLSELFRHWPQVLPAFWNRNMLCPGCPIAPFHTVTEACAEYHLDEEIFRHDLARRKRQAATCVSPARHSTAPAHGDR